MNAENTAATWPDDVTTRYITVAGEILRDPTLVVDLKASIVRPSARCAGCGLTREASLPTVQAWAQDHAAACRALPRPDGAR